MTREQILEKVRKIVTRELSTSITKLTETASFYFDLCADSRDMWDVIMAIEEEFDINVPEKLTNQTIGDLVNHIMFKLHAAQKEPVIV